jgi:hypothetical protein
MYSLPGWSLAWSGETKASMERAMSNKGKYDGNKTLPNPYKAFEPIADAPAQLRVRGMRNDERLRA